jgi:hypothetical protein|tara:strand:+ start:27 stop:251 length:225 start_codon:yes stop_codon:yes gene_type:complete
MENSYKKFLKQVALDLELPKGWAVQSFVVDHDGFEVSVFHSETGAWGYDYKTTYKAVIKAILKVVEELQEEYEI